MFDQFSYLYVEDDPLSREIMDVVMKSIMMVKSFVMFENSANFMARLEALPQPPDFILLDIHIEPHSGFDLLDMIRANGAYANASIVALTASVMNQEVEQLKHSGFDGAIAKPVDVRVFPDLMRQIINGESVWYIA
ncbi:MAG: response regulator [Chloroflexota bacterium]|nr:response regulator [Chloroflexota bacterium]